MFRRDRHWMLGALAAAAALLTCAAGAPAQTERPVWPQQRVAAIYFHRTQRCPTCRMVSAYIKEALDSGFASAMRRHRVTFHLMDYQDPRNSRYAVGYHVTRPTLVLAKVEGGKVVAWKAMPNVWSLVARKQEFFRYVQNGVREYLETLQR